MNKSRFEKNKQDTHPKFCSLRIGSSVKLKWVSSLVLFSSLVFVTELGCIDYE